MILRNQNAIRIAFDDFLLLGIPLPDLCCVALSLLSFAHVLLDTHEATASQQSRFPGPSTTLQKSLALAISRNKVTNVRGLCNAFVLIIRPWLLCIKRVTFGEEKKRGKKEQSPSQPVWLSAATWHTIVLVSGERYSMDQEESHGQVQAGCCGSLHSYHTFLASPAAVTSTLAHLRERIHILT